MYAVIGLGNPGNNYTDTRHNIGFRVIDLLAMRNNIKVNKIKFKSSYGDGFIGKKKVLLIKPLTYMNNSGIALKEIKQFYKLPIEKIIVILDDVDIEFSTIRIRPGGSAGSHNGLKSIINHLQETDFPRLKIGIGDKGQYEDLADFVLSKFTSREIPIIEDSILKATEAVETMIDKGIEEAMNKYNVKANKAQE